MSADATPPSDYTRKVYATVLDLDCLPHLLNSSDRWLMGVRDTGLDANQYLCLRFTRWLLRGIPFWNSDITNAVLTVGTILAETPVHACSNLTLWAIATTVYIPPRDSSSRLQLWAATTMKVAYGELLRRLDPFIVRADVPPPPDEGGPASGVRRWLCRSCSMPLRACTCGETADGFFPVANVKALESEVPEAVYERLMSLTVYGFVSGAIGADCCPGPL